MLSRRVGVGEEYLKFFRNLRDVWSREMAYWVMQGFGGIFLVVFFLPALMQWINIGKYNLRQQHDVDKPIFKTLYSKACPCGGGWENEFL